MNRRPILTLFTLIIFLSVAAQQDQRTVNEKCGTMQRLNMNLQQSARLRERFEQERIQFNKVASSRSLNRNGTRIATVYIPVVFHIVLPNPNIVTDAQVLAQLDTLNKDFFGANGDSVKIPSYFKPLFGKSGIQFCLAQRNPEGDATNGIDRVFTNQASFSIDDGVKHDYAGGVASWNTDKYFNVWVCLMSNSILGYATFPNDPTTSAADQGVVIDYRALPDGPFTSYNQGKTLTHETGHFFNLFHIWGDDNGACTGSDDVSDTPNQADASSGCYSGIKTDACTTGGNGIMYQNYMDYTDDPCLVMFTTEQMSRMETALTTSRPTLLTSNGCQPVVLSPYDVQLRTVNQPSQRLCTAAFTPQVTIKNRGTVNLTSLQISTKIDNGPVTPTSWTGSLTTYNTTVITLTGLTATAGTHTLTVYVSNPNNNADQDRSNDTLQISFQYFPPVTSVSESFESTTFPPAGWDIVNPDKSITWQRVTLASKTGNASVRMDNYNYNLAAIGQTDDLRMPSISIPAGVDSAFLSFQVAAAVVTSLNATGNNWDTLQVLISKDCGQTYTSLYKKWGKNLVTDSIPEGNEFIPSSNQWRKDSINLASYIGADNFLITFRNTSGVENEVYLDDINVRTQNVNPNLKAQGFLVTPNPTAGNITVQFYPQPTNLRGIQVFNYIGQKIAEISVAKDGANNNYYFDLSHYQRGMYLVRAVFTDRVITRKVIKF